MEIDFLRHFGFSPPLIETLVATYGRDFLPLQEKVIREGELFSGHNLLIYAPTSAGKTFLGELVFLDQVQKNRNAILLVPTKALANQRYEQLQERYSALGYDIVLSTRDHTHEDERILEGSFHLAIIIYEKLRSLLAVRQAFLSSLGACIVDEAHYLFHSSRGADLEILLSIFLQEKQIQLLAMSAVIRDPQVAEWLRARLVVETKRPVELRQGVLCQGKFSYVEFNSDQQGVEEFPIEAYQDVGEQMLECARYFACQGETTLLFWPRKDLCYTAARKLAEHYEEDESLDLSLLDSLEKTALKEFLETMLRKRIAVHTADLSPQERLVVETYVRKGEVVLLCATSTLAEGINIPVVNVLTTERVYASSSSGNSAKRPPMPIPISQDRLLNMVGRAGRLGLCPFGRGMVVTSSHGSVDGLMRTYSKEKKKPLQPQLQQLNIQDILLRMVILYQAFRHEDCVALLQKTYSAFEEQWAAIEHDPVKNALFQLSEDGFLTCEEDLFYPTLLGKLVIKNGVSLVTAKAMQHYCTTTLKTTCDPIDILTFIAIRDEIDEVYLRVPRKEILTHAWSREMISYQEAKGLSDISYLAGVLKHPEQLRDAHHSAFKKALLLYTWIKPTPMLEMERQFGIYAGTLYRLAEEVSWLLHCLFEMASAYLLPAEFILAISRLRDQVELGLPESALGWAGLLRQNKILRNQVLTLLKHGYSAPERIHQDDREMLEALLPHEIVEMLYTNKGEPASVQSFGYIVEVSSSRPDLIRVNGKALSFTKLQARLIRILSAKPGECLLYDDIYEKLWPDSIGEKTKLYKLKSQILDKVHNTVGLCSPPFIEAITGEGLLLNAKIIQQG